MLDMSKLQAGVMEKKDTVYNLTESIESVLERYNKLKEQDGYCIHFEYDGKVQVKADEYKIFQVIYNLINNASFITAVIMSKILSTAHRKTVILALRNALICFFSGNFLPGRN